MPLTVNSIAYSNDTPRTPDSYRYTGPENTASTKDYLDLKRVSAKPSNGSLGKTRAQAKLTRTMTDGTDPIDDGIISLDIAIPVGSASAEIAALLLDLSTWATTAAALALVEDHDINQ
jgi:hypothetical protein